MGWGGLKIRQTIPEVMADLRETSFILLEHNTHKQTMLERTIDIKMDRELAPENAKKLRESTVVWENRTVRQLSREGRCLLAATASRANIQQLHILIRSDHNPLAGSGYRKIIPDPCHSRSEMFLK